MHVSDQLMYELVGTAEHCSMRMSGRGLRDNGGSEEGCGVLLPRLYRLPPSLTDGLAATGHPNPLCAPRVAGQAKQTRVTHRKLHKA